MKCSYIIALLFFSFVPNKELEQFLNQNYLGGAKGFYQTIYKNLEYPSEARSCCIASRIDVVVEIDSLGIISDLEFQNTIGYNIEQAIENAMTSTEGNWKQSKSNRKIEMSFAFKIDDLKNELKADFETWAGSSSHSPEGRCKSEKELRSTMFYYIKRNGLHEAKSKCKKLLKRHPWSLYLDSLNLELSHN